MVQIQPLDVRDQSDGEPVVVFHVPDALDLHVAIPAAQLSVVRKAFGEREKGPSLFSLWCATYASDGQYTEVIVEADGSFARLSVVAVSGGLVWRTPLEPVDAILTGFHFRLPFFLTEPALVEKIPAPLHLPWPVRAAAVRGARPLPGPAGG